MPKFIFLFSSASVLNFFKSKYLLGKVAVRF